MTVTLKTRRARKRVAVVGTGLAGLTAGYLLARQGCDVYLLEKVRLLQGVHDCCSLHAVTCLRLPFVQPGDSNRH